MVTLGPPEKSETSTWRLGKAPVLGDATEEVRSGPPSEVGRVEVLSTYGLGSGLFTSLGSGSWGE